MPTTSLIFLLATSGDKTQQSAVPPLNCGQSSVFIFLTVVGQPARMADLDRDFAKLANETSFRDLSEVISRHGCGTLGVQISESALRAASIPAIVQLVDPLTQRLHFVVCYSHAGHLVLFDPLDSQPAAVAGVVEQWFRERYSGFILIRAADLARVNQAVRLTTDAPHRVWALAGSVVLVLAGVAVWLRSKSRKGHRC